MMVRARRFGYLRPRSKSAFMVTLIKAFTTLFPAVKWFRKIPGEQVPKAQGSSISYCDATAKKTRPTAVFYDISGN